jgi:serine/threonine protein kinase
MNHKAIQNPMPISPATRLGPYGIVALLGAGGMGEVLKARDTRLNRFVAIKILREERLLDQTHKQRFIQEARAASALNHPNIITIYDIAVDNGRDYMVMEYVPGKTLDALIPRTGMRLGKLLKIAIQVAEGLREAHAAGIIHRDLKPSNIMVSESGLVKILDFGLAKVPERVKVTEKDATQSLNPQTEAGAVMGTAAYMSPEQAGGKPLDARSDIFSLGAVLYEMATGRRAFSGDSQVATMAAVLNLEPKPLCEAAPGLPHDLERVIMRCLRKDPAKRQQDMTDVKLSLEELKEESESDKTATAVASKPKRPRWPWVAAREIDAHTHIPKELANDIITAAIAGFEQQKIRINTQIAELRAMLNVDPVPRAIAEWCNSGRATHRAKGCCPRLT